MTLRIRLIALLAAAMLLAACTGSTDAPARAVESYLQALARKDADRLAQLSCADWADDAQQALDSFAAVDVTLRDVSCRTSAVEDDIASVSCTGALAATYQGEVRELDLSKQVFEVVNQSGDWLVCSND